MWLRAHWTPGRIDSRGTLVNRNSVTLRWLSLDRIAATDWPRLERLLDASECSRARRFHFERDRHAYIAAHALVRGMLSRLAGFAPREWRFTVNAHGKPELLPPPGVPRFRTNLSHTRGLVVAALTVEHDVGVDVEWLDRDNLSMDLAGRYFAPAEYALLEMIPDPRRRAALFAIWTLKEAYIKAVGLGLKLPLDAFAFSLDPLAISFSADVEERSRDWLFRRFRPTASHMMALALRHPNPQQVTVTAQPADLEHLLHLGDQALGCAHDGTRT